MGNSDSKKTKDGENFESNSETKDTRFENFTEDLFLLVSKASPSLLEEGSFQIHDNKSRLSTSFMLNGETFLVWAGKSSKPQVSHLLHIYNLSLRKKELSIEGLESKQNPMFNYPSLTVVSTYPQYSSYETKKWLYTGDRDGWFRIFELSATAEKFKEIFTLNVFGTESNSVLSAVICEDKHNELLSKEEINRILIIIHLGNSSENLIYNLQGKITQKVPNPDNHVCSTINYFYDEEKRKTCIFFGFSNSFVQMLDLKSNTFIKKFKTSNEVYSINFILKEATEKLLLFTVRDSHSLFIYNIENENLVKTIEFPDYCLIMYDVCLWNNKFLIATSFRSSEEKSSLFIADVETKEVKTIECLDSNEAQNLVKVLVKSASNEELKEGLVSCHRNGNVYLYI